jgi:hypothetical protein
VDREIRKFGGWDHQVVLAIAEAENRSCDPNRHNLTASETHRNYKGEVICVGSYGVLQVGCLHYRDGEDRNDLATNIKVAYRVWQGAGYTAWTQYKNGAYQEFLK